MPFSGVCSTIIPNGSLCLLLSNAPFTFPLSQTSQCCSPMLSKCYERRLSLRAKWFFSRRIPQSDF
jgi:hypothetical protein